MKILLTADPEIPVPPTGYGGIERIIAGLIRYLRSNGHEVGLVAHPDSIEPVDARFDWPGGRSQSRLDTVRNAAALRRAAAAFKPDLIHSFSRLAYLLPLFAARWPLLMSYQREPSLRTTRWARRLARGRLSFSGCSEYIAGLGRRAGGDWMAIPNFVDTDALPFNPSVAASAPLLFLSRVEAIKGAHIAITVAQRSARRLIIAGNVPADERSQAYFREQIAPHLREGQIDYIGEIDDQCKAQLLPAAAALLVPIEWNEPFGIVFAEALSCGTPVISRPRGALPEIVRDGQEGFLAESVDRLVEHVQHVPQLDRRQCRRRAEERFSRAVVGARYVALYEQLIARHNAS